MFAWWTREWAGISQSIWDSLKSLNIPSNCSHERCLQIAFPHRWYQPRQSLSGAWHTERVLLLPTSLGHCTLAVSLTAIIHKEPEMEVTAAQMCLHPRLGKLVLPFVGGVWDSAHMGHTPLAPAYVPSSMVSCKNRRIAPRIKNQKQEQEWFGNDVNYYYKVNSLG